MFKLIFYFLSVVCSFCMLEKLLLLPPFSGTCVIIFPFFQGIKYRLFFNRGMKIEEKNLIITIHDYFGATEIDFGSEKTIGERFADIFWRF